MSIFTSKKVWNFLIKIQLTKCDPKRTRRKKYYPSCQLGLSEDLVYQFIRRTHLLQACLLCHSCLFGTHFLLPMSQKLSSACCVHSVVKMIQSKSLNETFTVRQFYICTQYGFIGQFDYSNTIQGVLALCYFWDLGKSHISQKSHQQNFYFMYAVTK